MKTALITGAGRREGIGFESARQLAQQGMQVFLSARSIEKTHPLGRLNCFLRSFVQYLSNKTIMPIDQEMRDVICA